MLKFAKVSTVLSLAIAALAVVSAALHALQLGSPGYTTSPLILVEILAILGALLWLLPQLVALAVMIAKQEQAGRWTLVAAFALLSLLLGGYAACAIDEETVLFST